MFRRTGVRYADCCIVEVNRFGGGGLMVWAGISRNFKADLHIVRGRLNAAAYRDNILQSIVVPLMRNNGLTLLQQDNARPHTASFNNRLPMSATSQRHAMAFVKPGPQSNRASVG